VLDRIADRPLLSLVCAQHYLNPLRSAIDNKKEIITAADIKNIFGGIEVIYQYNSALLKVGHFPPHLCPSLVYGLICPLLFEALLTYPL
jgi:hypothetical protein